VNVLKNRKEKTEGGAKIEAKDGNLLVPDNPFICYIEGDGVGPEVMSVGRDVINSAIERVYRGKKKIFWLKLPAGNEAMNLYSSPLPDETIEAIRSYRICIKGPLTTPVGGGHRSLNVAIRQALNLYACVRPVSYIPGLPTPVKHPEKVDMVVFRENTEDVYAGIEWQQGSKEALDVITFLNTKMGTTISTDAGVGIKPISIRPTKQLVRASIEFALTNSRKSVTLVTKGNIMKYTEGAFRAWGYEVAREEFGKYVITENELNEKGAGEIPDGKVVVKDRLADDMLQQILLYPEKYDVIATTNLNGDYLSDALAAQVGGLGIAPGANLGHQIAVFEATHGTAPDIAGENVVNPTALILSGVLMLDHIGWSKAAKVLKEALEQTIASKQVTKDLALQFEGVPPLSTVDFGRALISNIL
jgi:isocitrate dehydrogenase